MQQYLILAILAALVILLCIEDFLIVQETCSNSRPEVPPAQGTKGKHSETQREAADENEAVVDQRISGS